MTSAAQPPSSAEGQGRSRSKTLQLLGILSGFTAGAWLGAAEAPTKLVSIGISPMAISLIMVIGVFLALWSLPALILGTSSVRADVRRAPHLMIWAVLAGCLWAVANTLTILAIRDIGLSIAFPLWNSNLLNNVLLVAAAFTVFFGTVFPLLSEAVRGVKVSVGAPFFNQVNVPLFLSLIFLMGVGPLIAWRRASLDNLARNFLWPVVLGVVAAAAAFVLGVRSSL